MKSQNPEWLTMEGEESSQRTDTTQVRIKQDSVILAKIQADRQNMLPWWLRG